jgi:hypothetical protein
MTTPLSPYERDYPHLSLRTIKRLANLPSHLLRLRRGTLQSAVEEVALIDRLLKAKAAMAGLAETLEQRRKPST